LEGANARSEIHTEKITSAMHKSKHQSTFLRKIASPIANIMMAILEITKPADPVVAHVTINTIPAMTPFQRTRVNSLSLPSFQTFFEIPKSKYQSEKDERSDGQQRID
jgi:hypothetical protein